MTGDTNVNEKSSVSLDFSGSTDPNGDSLTFSFEQLSGKSATFSSTGGVLDITGT